MGGGGLDNRLKGLFTGLCNYRYELWLLSAIIFLNNQPRIIWIKK